MKILSDILPDDAIISIDVGRTDGGLVGILK